MARNQQSCAVQQQSLSLLQWNSKLTMSSAELAEARDATASDVSIMRFALKSAIVEYRYTEKKDKHVL